MKQAVAICFFSLAVFFAYAEEAVKIKDNAMLVEVSTTAQTHEPTAPIVATIAQDAMEKVRNKRGLLVKKLLLAKIGLGAIAAKGLYHGGLYDHDHYHHHHYPEHHYHSYPVYHGHYHHGYDDHDHYHGGYGHSGFYAGIDFAGGHGGW